MTMLILVKTIELHEQGRDYTAKNAKKKICPFLENEDFFSKRAFFSQIGE